MSLYGVLLFFFFMEYVRPTSFVPALNLLHLNSLALYAVAFGSLLKPDTLTNAALLAERNTKLLLVFLGILVVSIVASQSSLLAFEMWRAVFEYTLLYVALVKQGNTLQRIKGIFATLVLVNMAVAVLTPSLLTSAERRNIASGNFLGDANDFALSVNVAITLCLFLVFESKARTRILSTLALLFLVFVVVVTQSRGGTLALVAVGLYYWLKGANKLRTAAIVAAGAMVVLLLAPPTYWSRMNDIVNTGEGSAAGRIEAWQGGWRMALDHPLFGVGAGRFSFAYGSEYRTSPNTPYQTAHSIYFLNLGELGFPGLIILIALIASNLAENRRLTRELKARGEPATGTDRRLLASLSTAMLAFAIGGAFLSAVYYPHLYVIAGLSTASRRLVRQRTLSPHVDRAAPATREMHIHWALRPAPRSLTP
jgi:probable O-glycosylation ligase (exosortase A-associated)